MNTIKTASLILNLIIVIAVLAIIFVMMAPDKSSIFSPTTLTIIALFVVITIIRMITANRSHKK